jgi:UDP-GlcNAc:undecaprenyl-phosphate GlcNAc-1-phosphate transferase
MGIALGLLIVIWLTGAPFILWAHQRFGWLRLNFRGDRIPCSLGLFPLLIGLISWSLFRPLEWAWLAVLGFGILGFWDDRFGQNSPKGLRGHLGAFRQGKITTGLLKLAGGVVLALFISYSHHSHSSSSYFLPSMFLSALLIALAANFFNLLDTRPGRSISLFVVMAGVFLYFYLKSSEHFWTHPALWIYLGVWRVLSLDRRALGMMGDTGSNLMGATTGILLISMPFLVQFILVLLLMLFHLWAERNSFSEHVERVDWLQRLDRLTGVR